MQRLWESGSQMLCIYTLHLHLNFKRVSPSAFLLTCVTKCSLFPMAGANLPRILSQRVIFHRNWNEPRSRLISKTIQGVAMIEPFSAPKVSTINNGSRSRLTKSIIEIALGRHAFCLHKSRAGNTPAFDLLVESFRPCSLDIAKLNGPEEVNFINSSRIKIRCFQRSLTKINSSTFRHL